ncbi:MAG TPA: hypothetical protein VFU88_20285 [Ktedonobacterales bacterium]|nr:hypothetical protein [Ktedonobacterales bacterium]
MILSLHGFIFYVVLALGAVTLLAGLVLIWMSRRAKGSAAGETLAPLGGYVSVQRVFRGLLWVTAIAGVVQGALGGILYLQGARAGVGLHYVYGLIVLAAIPVAYVYSDQKQQRRDIIIMTIAAAAIVGAAIRAFATGAP